jgi:hypothetical protein
MADSTHHATALPLRDSALHKRARLFRRMRDALASYTSHKLQLPRLRVALCKPTESLAHPFRLAACNTTASPTTPSLCSGPPASVSTAPTSRFKSKIKNGCLTPGARQPRSAASRAASQRWNLHEPVVCASCALRRGSSSCSTSPNLCASSSRRLRRACMGCRDGTPSSQGTSRCPCCERMPARGVLFVLFGGEGTTDSAGAGGRPGGRVAAVG